MSQWRGWGATHNKDIFLSLIPPLGNADTSLIAWSVHNDGLWGAYYTFEFIQFFLVTRWYLELSTAPGFSIEWPSQAGGESVSPPSHLGKGLASAPSDCYTRLLLIVTCLCHPDVPFPSPNHTAKILGHCHLQGPWSHLVQITTGSRPLFASLSSFKMPPKTHRFGYA